VPGKHYIIRGGIEGRERLRILSRVMQPTTHHALRRAGIRQGMSCLDTGCGGGDLAFDMARMVGSTGTVVGTDIDQKKLEPARQEAAEQGLGNAEFQLADITETDPEGQFDLIHARFVLAHLANPAQALARMRGALRTGGVIVLEDNIFASRRAPLFGATSNSTRRPSGGGALIRTSGRACHPYLPKQALRTCRST
jgi:ubiquinone/menaquinone biosynthesis C-methylase UbiE